MIDESKIIGRFRYKDLPLYSKHLNTSRSNFIKENYRETFVYLLED